MNPDDRRAPGNPWLQWQQGAAPWRQAFATDPPGAGTDPGGVAAWYAAVAAELQQVMVARDPATLQQALESFSTRCFITGPAAPWQAFAIGASPAAAAGSGASPAYPTAALGPAREHQQRAAALATALAALTAAQQALVPLLDGAARAAAAAFATRQSAGAAPGARAALETWIECAEGAWQELARGEAWCLAQARALGAALTVRACEQEIAEHAARLAGAPTRREIDDLHRRMRDLERGARRP